MKRNLFLLLLVALFFASCQKDEITVVLKQAGSLSFQLTDNAGTKYNGVAVKIYSSYYTSGGSTYFSGELDKKVTDSEGKADFGELNAGTYYVVADTLKTGNKKYLVAKSVQVIGGSSKNYVLNADDFTGKVTLNINLYSSYTNDTLEVQNIKVALLEYNYSFNPQNRKEALNKAVIIASLDENGRVIINNVPANFTYMLYFFVNNNDSVGYLSYSNNFSVSTGGNNSYSFSVYSNYLYYLLSDFTASFYYYSYNSYTNEPVKNANVVIIKYNDYYNYDLNYASIATIRSHKVAEYITDNNGNISGKLPVSSDYKAFVYYDSINKDWSSSFYLYTNSINNNFSLNLYGSNLGLAKK